MCKGAQPGKTKPTGTLLLSAAAARQGAAAKKGTDCNTIQRPTSSDMDNTDRAKTVQKPCTHGLQNKKAMKSFDFTAFSGASSDTEFFENHRSTIRFQGHRIATCLYRTPMGSCIEKTVAFYIPHNLKIIKYAQRSLLPSPGANERCFFCLQRKEASVKWQFFG